MGDEDVSAPAVEEVVEETTTTTTKKPAAAPAPARKAAPSSSSSSSSSACGGCCGDIFAPLKSNPVCEELGKIFLWEKIMTSLAAFVVVNACFLLILYGGWSFLTLGALVLLVLLVAAFAVGQGPVLYGKHIAKKDVASPLEGKIPEAPVDSIVSVFGALGDVFAALIGVAYNIIFTKEIPVFVGSLCFFIFLAILGCKARITAIAYVAILIAFIWPRLYKEQKGHIDSLFEKVTAILKEQYEKVNQKIQEALNKPKAA